MKTGILSDRQIIGLGLVLGAGGWLLHTANIFLAYTSPGRYQWEVVIDFNHFGEGYVEIVLIPAIMMFILYGSYRFKKRSQ